jgi:hypothetical protein
MMAESKVGDSLPAKTADPQLAPSVGPERESHGGAIIRVLGETDEMGSPLIVKAADNFIREHPTVALNLLLGHLSWLLGYTDLCHFFAENPNLRCKQGLTAANAVQRTFIIHSRILYGSGGLASHQDKLLLSVVPPAQRGQKSALRNFGQLVLNMPTDTLPAPSDPNARAKLNRVGVLDPHIQSVVTTCSADTAVITDELSKHQLDAKLRRTLIEMLCAASVKSCSVISAITGTNAFLTATGDMERMATPDVVVETRGAECGPDDHDSGSDAGSAPDASSESGSSSGSDSSSESGSSARASDPESAREGARAAGPCPLRWLQRQIHVAADGSASPRFLELAALIIRSSNVHGAAFSSSGYAEQSPYKRRRSPTELASERRILLGISDALGRAAHAGAFPSAVRMSVNDATLRTILFLAALRFFTGHADSGSPRYDVPSLTTLVRLAAARGSELRFSDGTIGSVVASLGDMLSRPRAAGTGEPSDGEPSDDESSDGLSSSVDSGVFDAAASVIDEHTPALQSATDNHAARFDLGAGGREATAIVNSIGMIVKCTINYTTTNNRVDISSPPNRRASTSAVPVRRHQNPDARAQSRPSNRRCHKDFAGYIGKALSRAADAYYKTPESRGDRAAPRGRVPMEIGSWTQTYRAGSNKSDFCFYNADRSMHRTFEDTKLANPKKEGDARFLRRVFEDSVMPVSPSTPGAPGTFEFRLSEWPFKDLVHPTFRCVGTLSEIAKRVSAATSHTHAPPVAALVPLAHKSRRPRQRATRASSRSAPAVSSAVSSSGDSDDESSDGESEETADEESDEPSDETSGDESEAPSDESGDESGDVPIADAESMDADIKGLICSLLANEAELLKAALKADAPNFNEIATELEKRPVSAVQSLALLELIRTRAEFARVFVWAGRTYDAFADSEHLPQHIGRVWPYGHVVTASEAFGKQQEQHEELGLYELSCVGIPTLYEMQRQRRMAENEAIITALGIPESRKHDAQQTKTSEDERWNAKYASLSAHILVFEKEVGVARICELLLHQQPLTTLCMWAAKHVALYNRGALQDEKTSRLAELAGWPWCLPMHGYSVRSSSALVTAV